MCTTCTRIPVPGYCVDIAASTTSHYKNTRDTDLETKTLLSVINSFLILLLAVTKATEFEMKSQLLIAKLLQEGMQQLPFGRHLETNTSKLCPFCHRRPHQSYPTPPLFQYCHPQAGPTLNSFLFPKKILDISKNSGIVYNPPSIPVAQPTPFLIYMLFWCLALYYFALGCFIF